MIPSAGAIMEEAIEESMTEMETRMTIDIRRQRGQFRGLRASPSSKSTISSCVVLDRVVVSISLLSRCLAAAGSKTDKIVVAISHCINTRSSSHYDTLCSCRCRRRDCHAWCASTRVSFLKSPASLSLVSCHPKTLTMLYVPCSYSSFQSIGPPALFARLSAVIVRDKDGVFAKVCEP